LAQFGFWISAGCGLQLQGFEIDAHAFSVDSSLFLMFQKLETRIPTTSSFTKRHRHNHGMPALNVDPGVYDGIDQKLAGLKGSTPPFCPRLQVLEC